MSGYDPAAPALDLIKRVGIYGLGGNEGCPCTNFEVQSVHVGVSCHKSEQTVRVYSHSLDFFEGGFGEPVKQNTDALQQIADEVLRQVDGYYEAGGEYASAFTVRFCSWNDDHPSHTAGSS